jgi:DNA-binding NarL/FixJ family response regulator
MIRVFLVDDHELVRRGITALLNAESDIEVVGEAGTAAQARVRLRATSPDIAVLDVRLPDGSGIDVCREIRSENPAIRCLILTGYDDDEAIYAAVLAGASGYVIKDVHGSGLIDSLRRVFAGESLIDPSLSKRVVERINESHRSDPRLQSLTSREREILPLIAEGLTNREIGVRLALAEKTVKNYISGLLSKLGLQRRTQAAIMHLESQPTGSPLSTT